MCIILVSPLYLLKYHHLPSPILFNSYLPSAKSIGVKRRATSELLLGRQPSGHPSAPAWSLLQPSSNRHWLDPHLSKDWSKTGGPACRTQSRNMVSDRVWSQLWLLQSGPKSLSQKIRSLNRKALAGCPQLGGGELQTQLGWAGPSPPSLWDEAGLAPLGAQKAPKALANSQEPQEVIPPTPPRTHNTYFPVLIHKPLPHRVSSSVKDAFIMFREGLSLPGKNMH